MKLMKERRQFSKEKFILWKEPPELNVLEAGWAK
jgi:hypothetical protein